MASKERNASLAELAEGRLGSLLFKYSWPALVAMSLNALYAVVDRFYIGQGCGEAAMAALTLAMPVMMFFGACGVFIGAGHSALLSIKLGEGDQTACERIMGELVTLKLLFFLVLPPLVFLNLDAVIGWCGGREVSAEAFEQARTYLRLVMFSHLFSHLSFGLSAAMRSEGRSVRSMTCMIIGFGANLLLDPILIFGVDIAWLPVRVPAMGVAGAAWATNIAMALSCLYALSYYWSGRSVVKLRWRRLGLYRAFVSRAAGIGLAPFLQQFLGALINVVLAAAFGKWAADEAAATQQIASLGVFQSVMILVLMPILGAQQGLQPIFGYNWGARNYRRVRDALFLGFWTTTALCVIASLIQVIPAFAERLVALFVAADNPELRALAVGDLQLSNCMLWCIGLNVVATTFFQSIGRPGVAIVLSTLRQGVVLLPIAWFLPYFVQNHNAAIWLSMPVSDVACCLLTILPLGLYVRFLSRLRTRRP